MRAQGPGLVLLLSPLLASACGDSAGPKAAPPDAGPGARSTALSPQQPPEHYVEQGLKYFDTFDTSADRASVPAYSVQVERWEWPPWLKLTGHTRELILATDPVALRADPSTVPVRDCRAFRVQPFARCYVSFQYEKGPCPIYEEFTFNDQGEITFIEAWSNQPSSLPMMDPADRWAEGPRVHRLSTRIPGLGNATGLIDLDAAWMQEAAAADPEVADFVMRAHNFWGYWFDEYQAAGATLYARGCGW